MFGLLFSGLNSRHYAMTPVLRKTCFVLPVCCIGILLGEPAQALRCGTKLVKDGMIESQVIEICGEPVSRHNLGYVLRPYILKRPANTFGTHATERVYSGYHEEIMVTELVFNFGPRKLMRVLRFEGNRLKSIETAGYGYQK